MTQGGIAGLLTTTGDEPLVLSLSRELVDDDLESSSRLSFEPWWLDSSFSTSLNKKIRSVNDLNGWDWIVE